MKKKIIISFIILGVLVLSVSFYFGLTKNNDTINESNKIAIQQKNEVVINQTQNTAVVTNEIKSQKLTNETATNTIIETTPKADKKEETIVEEKQDNIEESNSEVQEDSNTDNIYIEDEISTKVELQIADEPIVEEIEVNEQSIDDEVEENIDESTEENNEQENEQVAYEGSFVVRYTQEEWEREQSNQAPEEEYVRNDAMIEKIRNVIINNESEYMQEYGYTVVVDESIKADTNPFTYTEKRVKAYINNCFGTIKIYAEDYYRNGKLVMTECYIL